MNYSWSNDDGFSKFVMQNDRAAFELYSCMYNNQVHAWMVGNQGQWNEVQEALDFSANAEQFLEDLIKFATSALADIRNPNK
jgi:hypothetical protein